jgi:hypothetical protein
MSLRGENWEALDVDPFCRSRRDVARQAVLLVVRCDLLVGPVGLEQGPSPPVAPSARPLRCPVIFISLLLIASIGPVPNGGLFSRQHSAYAAGRSTICQNGCHAEVSQCCYNDSANAPSDRQRSCAMSASCWERMTFASARTDADDRDAAYAVNEDYRRARNRRTS